jgi:hypothetical protein
MQPASPAASVLAVVATWPGVGTKTTPRGATAIVFAGQELGHVHADRGTLDLPLPDDRRAEVLKAARAKEWYANWLTKPLANDGDAADAIALLRESYDALHAR